MDLGNMDLAHLIAYKLKINWKASLHLSAQISEYSLATDAETFLKYLAEAARIPNTEFHVLVGNIEDYVEYQPMASLSIFSLPSDPDLDFVREMVERTGTACLFALDLGEENALA